MRGELHEVEGFRLERAAWGMSFNRVLTEDDGCRLSQWLSLLEFRNPSPVCSMGLCPPRMRGEVTLPSPLRDVFPTQAGMGVGMIQSPGREQAKCLSEPIQPEMPGSPRATGCILMTYFSAPSDGRCG